MRIYLVLGVIAILTGLSLCSMGIIAWCGIPDESAVDVRFTEMESFGTGIGAALSARMAVINGSAGAALILISIPLLLRGVRAREADAEAEADTEGETAAEAECEAGAEAAADTETRVDGSGQ